MKVVILHHAHHRDEKVYRIITAEEHVSQHVIEVEDEEGNLQHQIESRVEHRNRKEVVWADWDDQWKDMSPGAIAEWQRAKIREVHQENERRQAEALRLQQERENSIEHFGSAGEEL